MPNTSLISSTSFASLEIALAQEVAQVVQHLQQANDLSEAIGKHFNTPKTIRATVSLMFYSETLLKTNPVLFLYLNDTQRLAFKNDLMLALYQLTDRFQLNEHEQRRLNAIADFSEIQHGLRLLSYLDDVNTIPEPTQAPSSSLYNLLFGRWANFFNGKSDHVIKDLSDFNYVRLYWVWAGTMLRSALAMLNDWFKTINVDTQNTQYIASNYQDIWGYISWSLYYLRFLLNIAMVLKHTIPGPWMEDEEQALVEEIGGLARFKSQFEERKFILINDFIWGIINMVCHLWCTGPSWWGYTGNVLTVLLLLGDLSLALLRRSDELAEHESTLDRFNLEIRELDDKFNDNTNDTTLKEQIFRLKQAREAYLTQWNHKQHGTKVDIVYAAGLVSAFVVLCACFIPDGVVSSATSGIFGMTGAGLLFSLALIYSSYKGYLEVARVEDAERKILYECQELVSSKDVWDDEMRFRFLQGMEEAHFQQTLADYQRHKMVRTIVVEGLVPFAMFAAFTFLPFGIAAAAFAVAIVLAAVWHYVIEASKPDGPKQIGREDLKQNISNADCAVVDARIDELKPNWIGSLFVPAVVQPEIGTFDQEQRVSIAEADALTLTMA